MTLLGFVAPTTARNIVLIVAGIGYVGYHVVRWLLERRKKSGKHHDQPTADAQVAQGAGATVAARTQSATNETAEKNEYVAEEATRLATDPQPAGVDPQPPTATPPSSTATLQPGEELYQRARSMKHQVIPDFRGDGLYLDMLGDSAAQGYAPAMAKLGDYAMRRGTWVEAYYWISMAQRAGTPNLESTLREIRRNWIRWGSHSEKENVNPLFSFEDGSVARALLSISLGRDADAAREFLRKTRPEFL